MISFKDSNHVHLNTSKNFPFVTLLHLPACSNPILSIFWAAHILILTVLIEMIAYVFRHSVFTGRQKVVCLLHTELLHQQIKFFLMLTTSIACTTIESLVVGRVSLVIFVDLIVVVDETPLVCHIGMCDIFFCNALTVSTLTLTGHVACAYAIRTNLLLFLTYILYFTCTFNPLQSDHILSSSSQIAHVFL